MDKEMLEMLETKLKDVVDNAMNTKLEETVASVVGKQVASETKKIVEKMALDKAMFGKDITGLSDEKKLAFADVIKSAALGMNINTKANEALIEETDARGGYLVATEVAGAILRIAASVGIVLNQATKWSMKTDELKIPAYDGTFLEGEYLGVDTAGSLTALAFKQATLLVKKWQFAFALGNDLLADTNIDLANWVLALAGESLANMVDKQGFVGTGAPFTGILNDTGATVFTLDAGKDTFIEFNVIEDANDVIATLEESMLPGAAWYMNRTVWAKLRSQKDGVGYYLLANQGAISAGLLVNYTGNGGVKPAGEMGGYPVFTCRHLPGITASAAATKYMVFGNMKGLAYGDKGEVRITPFTSGNFGGEIALKDQRALVMLHRHALVVALPAAFVVVKTHA